MDKKSPVIKNIVDTFNLLDILNEQGETSISDLVELLSVPKTTVFRIVKTLEEIKIIKQLPNSKYVLDYRLSAYAKNVSKNNYLVEIAKPFMEELCDTFSETVNLGVLYENQVLLVQSIEGDFYQLQASLVPVSPMYCSAMGKLFLTEFTKEEVETYFVDLPKRTVNTIVDSQSYFKHMEKMTKLGYSIDSEEYEYGLTCYAVPIRNSQGNIICGMSISGPSSRLEHKGIELIVSTLKEVGKRLELDLHERNCDVSN